MFSLAFSAVPALAASTLVISTDPCTQATCHGSTTTNHHPEVEPETYSNGSTSGARSSAGDPVLVQGSSVSNGRGGNPGKGLWRLQDGEADY